MRRPVSSVTNFVARLFAAVCAAGSGDIGAGVVALCCKGVSAARASRKSHANTPQANVSAITKNRRLASLAAKIFPRAIKKPREQSEASRHTLSRGECQLRPARVGSLTFVCASNPPVADSKSLPPGTLRKTSAHPSDSRLQWRDRGRFSRPSLKIEIHRDRFQFLPASR